MKLLRAILRALALAALTGFVYGSFFVGKVLRPKRHGHRWRNMWFRRWARGVLRVLGVKATVIGVPPQDALIVSNHVSYLDIPLIASQVDAVFVAKAEILEWPLVGTVCRGIDTIFIRRESKRDVVTVGEEMEARLASGLGVVFFPEGTSSDGTGVLPFKPSLLEVASRDLVPVHYATVRYSVSDGDPPATESVAWVGETPFLGHVRGLLQLSEIRAEVTFGAEPIVDRDRKALAMRLHEHVAAAIVGRRTGDGGRGTRDVAPSR
jgi:1-acyl-sn-glycerol-3-phosphate acyltransferase